MLKAKNIAEFFLTLSEPDEGDLISNLKLQKLCYYAQGFSLAIFNKLIFLEEIRAWEHGPVIPSLWKEYSEYHSQAIPMPNDFNIDIFSNEQQGLLREVWEVYGQFSAWKLRNMTHDESPWKETIRDEVITHELMKVYFLTLISK